MEMLLEKRSEMQSNKMQPTLTPTEARVFSQLKNFLRPGDEINPRYLFSRDGHKRRAIRTLHAKGVLLHHPAVDDHFDIYALGGNENFQVSGQYNPMKLRRAVRLQNGALVNKSGKAIFACKSMTKTQNEDCYHPTIDIETGGVRCDCKHFEVRLARFNPTVWSPEEKLCKHLLRAMANLERKALLPQQDGRFSPACIRCGVLDADDYFEVCDERGNAVAGQWICNDCAHGQTDDLGDVPEELADQAEADQAEADQAEADQVREEEYSRQERLITRNGSRPLLTMEEMDAEWDAEQRAEPEYSRCPFCSEPLRKVERESGAGLNTILVCAAHGQVEIEL